MPTFKTSKPEHTEFYVPAGDYRLRVVEAKDDTSKSGNDTIELLLQVIKDDGSKGPKLYDYLTFTEKAFWRVDHFLQACGKHPGEGKDISINAKDVVGWECRATLVVGETNKGAKRNEVAAYLWEAEDDFKN